MTTTEERSRVIKRFADPVVFVRTFWPQFTLYDKQKEIMYSVRDNYETIVPAGNELGKDFISGLIALWFFCSRRPCKVVTTSANGGQLEDVLWGEMRRFLQCSVLDLPVQYNHLKMRQVKNDGSLVANSELVGRVVQKGESMLGRHIARTAKNEPTTLLIVDEASGVDDLAYEAADTWTHRKLVIGNPYPCTNFFYKGTKEGNLESERKVTGEEELYRKVIRIKATDSPNIQLALEEKRIGFEPSHRELLPGVARYSDYLQRRKSWDKIRQCIGLDADFYEGAETLFFPTEWLNFAETYYETLPKHRDAKAIGIDPAEGKDSTTFAAIDDYGLIELLSIKTPDTAEVTAQTLAFMRRHGMPPEHEANCMRVMFDRGGGGKQHADRLRQQGYPVRTVGFGETPTKDPEPGLVGYKEKRRLKEERYVYKNKRAELYGRLRMRLDPSIEETRFAISKDETELRSQLAPIPLMYDPEGRLMLLPKGKRSANSKELTLIELIGHSPDEADAVALAIYALEVESLESVAGALI